MRNGILLVNLGTPESPAVADVRKYLSEFLMDERVIDIHPFLRFLLVRGIIVPFRAPKSARLYRKIWNAETGSPLLHYSKLQQQLLKLELDADHVVELAMRYQSPSIERGLNRLREAGADRIQVIPLFPQYASATTGSVVEEVMRVLRNWHYVPPVTISGAFYDHPLFIRGFAANAARHRPADYDHVLFSFHGLPERQLQACGHITSAATHDEECAQQITAKNKYCYAGQCHETARLIARDLSLSPDAYTVCFQSRLGKQEWVKPYTSSVITQLAAAGKKKLLVLCPAFVADCLETIHEIASEYRDEFLAAGGERLQLVESLNDSPLFIQALREIALAASPAAAKI
jgi:ferrochelatase